MIIMQTACMWIMFSLDWLISWAPFCHCRRISCLWLLPRPRRPARTADGVCLASIHFWKHSKWLKDIERQFQESFKLVFWNQDAWSFPNATGGLTPASSAHGKSSKKTRPLKIPELEQVFSPMPTVTTSSMTQLPDVGQHWSTLVNQPAEHLWLLLMFIKNHWLTRQLPVKKCGKRCRSCLSARRDGRVALCAAFNGTGHGLWGAGRSSDALCTATKGGVFGDGHWERDQDVEDCNRLFDSMNIWTVFRLWLSMIARYC